MEPFVLAIDLGTSGCKAALTTFSGKVVGWEFVPIETLFFPEGGAEQRPADWWNALLSAAGQLLSRETGWRDAVAAICCNTQGEGTAPVDASGAPLMNAILWMDARGAADLQRITHGPIRVAGYDALRLLRWIRLTGGAPSLTGKDPAAHMLYIKHRLPEVYAKTFKFLNVLDYLNLRLTGRFVATYDSILTSWVTDNRDVNAVKYHPALLSRCGVDADKFPEIVPCTADLGCVLEEVADALGLKRSVRVIAGAIDNTAAAIGSGATRDFAAHLYVGTSSWLAAHVPFKKTDIVTSIASVPCALPGKYLMTALQATAGGNLTFLRDKILYHKDELLREEHQPDVYKILDRIAAQTPAGSNGVIFTPWTFGERAPVEDRALRAGIYNLSLENSRADIIRALLEGVALNTRWLMGPVERFLGRRVDSINIVGGGGNSDVWCQIFADVLDRTIVQPVDPIQANVRGAAFIAAAGMGHAGFDAVPELVQIRKEYTPTAASRRTYDVLFNDFVDIYKRMRGFYARRNKQA